MSKGIYAYYDNLRCEIIYVGKDSYIDKNTRHKQHYQPSRRKQKINKVLQNDNKSGRYSYAVLEQGDFTKDELNQKEISWIAFFNPKFNFTEGGDGTALFGEKNGMYGKFGYWKGKKLSKEHREKISRAMFGKKLSKEHCEKISKTLTGIKRSKKTREKMSRAKSGKKLSKEHREKLSRSKSGKKLSKEHREKLSRSKSGKNNPQFDPCIKIRKRKQKSCKQGFSWIARPSTPEGKIALQSIDLQKCIKKVEDFINSNDNLYGYTHYKIILN